jgi:hypothetical protein
VEKNGLDVSVSSEASFGLEENLIKVIFAQYFGG